ncbi:MAG: hypothetical protein ACRDTP_06515, partial [Mycobacteriales bacterium]
TSVTGSRRLDSSVVSAEDNHIDHRRPSKVRGWLRAAGFTAEAELVLRPDDDVPGAVIIARRDT